MTDTILHLYGLKLSFFRATQPMWIYSTADLRFIQINDAAILNDDYRREDFKIMTISDIRPQRELPCLRQVVKETKGNRRYVAPFCHLRRDSGCY